MNYFKNFLKLKSFIKYIKRHIIILLANLSIKININIIIKLIKFLCNI